MLLIIFLSTFLFVHSFVEKCYFNGVLYSKTLSNWTQVECMEGFGSLIINENTDFIVEDLDEILGRVRKWKGTVTVENTKYKKISGFEYYFSFVANKYEDYALIVRNNSKLQEYLFGSFHTDECFGKIEISNNPKLSFDCDMLTDSWFHQSKVFNNKVDCGCFLDSPTTTANLEALPDGCVKLTGNITLEGGKNYELPSMELLERKLKTVEMFYGTITIANTNIENLKFLSSVVEFAWTPSFYQELPIPYLCIENNDKLTHLGWENLTGISIIQPKIQNNSDLCESYQEKRIFLTSTNSAADDAPVCEDSLLREGQYRMPPEGYSKLPNYGVNEIIGDLIINADTDISQIWKLSNVTTVFGQVIIENSKLVSTNNLWKISNIFDVGAGGGLRVSNNPLLRKAELISLNRITGNHSLLITDNPLASVASDVCEKYRKVGNTTILNNRGDCVQKRSVYMFNGNGSMTYFRYAISVIIFVTLVFH